MYTEIGCFEAKAKLSQLLQEVKRGKRFTITLRGQSIADLVPSDQGHIYDVAAAIASMRNIPKITGVSEDMVADWISEGRR